MLSKNTVIPIDTCGKTLRVLFLGNHYDHRDIVVKSTRTGNVEALYVDAFDDAKLDPTCALPYVEISPLEQGEFEVYTTDHNHTERSAGVKVVLTGEDRYTKLLTCATLTGTDTELLEDMHSLIPDDMTALTYLHKKYLQAESFAEKLGLTRLLLSCVSMRNLAIRSLKLAPMPLECDMATEMLQLDAECSTVLQKNLITGEVQPILPSPFDTRVYAAEEDDGLYLYAELDPYGLPLDFCYAFRPNALIYGYIKDDLVLNHERYRRAAEKAVMIPTGALSFRESEMPLLAIRSEMQPDIPVMHAPELVIGHGEASAVFTEEDRKILALFPDSLRLVINEPELALDRNQRRSIRIPGREFTFYASQLQLQGEDYVYWIEDNYGHILSDMRVLRKTQDFGSDINERLRQLGVQEYAKHLKPYLKATFSNALPLVQEALTICEGDKISGIQDVASSIISQSLQWDNRKNLPDLITGVMQDRTVYGDYVSKFFEQPLAYKGGDFTLALPPETSVLYRIECYSYKDGRKVEYFRSQKHEAIDYHFYDCDFAVVSVVDMRTGRSSGFLFFDFNNRKDNDAKVVKFLIDAKEVK